MRKSIDGLTLCVIELLMQQPQSGDVYLFFNQSRNKLKALCWDGNGFILYYKRMEKRKFALPRKMESSLILTENELKMLISGLDFMVFREKKSLVFSHFF